MRALSIACRILGHIWMAAFALVFVVSVVGMFVTAPSLYAGWQRVATTLSPFNIVNWIATVVLLLPGIGLYMASESLAKKLEKAQSIRRSVPARDSR